MGPTVALSGSPDIMGLAAGTYAVSGGSRASAESNFRELDDVFLQTQTRIWLAEVLQTRLQEQKNISDLLVDGELLFEVSKVIWRMFLTKKTELRYIEAYKYEPFASRKSGGRFMPYSNVASFLKICKIMGLSGIDLFSPSDVVEKQNTRKVCMCIRSLSKKARAKHLNIPDFDIVTYTVAMPTDMVGYIRRSLELSQRSPISSGSPSSSGHTQPKTRQKRSVSTPARNYDSYSDASDEEESGLRFLQFCTSSPSTYTPFKTNSDLDNTSEVSLDLDSYNPERNQFQLDSSKPEKFNIALDQFVPSWSNESVGSVCSQHDNQSEIISSSFRKVPEIHINSDANSKSEDKKSHGNSALNAYLGMNMKIQVPTVRNEVNGKILKRSHSAPQLAVSNMDFHYTGNFPDREGGTCSASSGAYSYGLCQMALDDKFRMLPDIDFVEVSSSSNINSVTSMVFNCGFDGLFHVEDDIRNFESEMVNQKDSNSQDSELLNQKDSSSQDSEMLNQKDGILHENDMSRYNSQDKNEYLLEDIIPDTDKTEFKTNFDDINVSTSLSLSSDTYFLVSCYNKESVTSGLLNDLHDESKLFEADSESLKNTNPGLLESSMLIQSHSPLHFQILDQKDRCRSKESDENGYSNGSIILEDIADVQCHGSDSFAGHRKKLSVGHVESVSKIMEDPNIYFQTCSSTGDFGYEDLYSVPRAVFGEDIEASGISSTSNRLQQGNVNPVISGKDQLKLQTVTISSIAECTTVEHLSQELTEVENRSNQDCKKPEVVNEPQVESSDKLEDRSPSAPERKPQGRAVLTNLLKGTVVVGAFVFLVQMRRSIRVGTEEPKVQSKERRRSQNRQSLDRLDSNLYPTEKLKF